MQKVRCLLHNCYKFSISGTFATPLSRYFSPFPHGTFLYRFEEVLALDDGTPIFNLYILLEIYSLALKVDIIRDC